MPNGTYPGTHQMRGRVDRTAGKNNLVAPELLFPPGDDCFDADATIAIEDQARHLRLSRDRQILPHPRAGIEIADRGGYPALISVGDGDREITVLPFRVLIDDVLPTGLFECLGHRFGVLGPQI